MIIKVFILWVCFGVIALHAAGDLHIFNIPNKDSKVNASMIEKALQANGFYISANMEMTGPFIKQFEHSDYKVFNLLTFFHKKHTASLIKSYPNTGVFIPMSLGIYQRKGESQLHISVLSARGMKKISNSSAPEFILIEKQLLMSLKKVLPKGTKHIESGDVLPNHGLLLSNYVKITDEKNWKNDKENLKMMMEQGLTPAGFLFSKITDYHSMLIDDSEETPFSFYDTYSICKLQILYSVVKTHPEASAFAPCTLIMYKKKNEEKIVIGFPRVGNWINSNRASDIEVKKVMSNAQKDFEAAFSNVVD